MVSCLAILAYVFSPGQLDTLLSSDCKAGPSMCPEMLQKEKILDLAPPSSSGSRGRQKNLSTPTAWLYVRAMVFPGHFQIEDSITNRNGI